MKRPTPREKQKPLGASSPEKELLYGVRYVRASTGRVLFFVYGKSAVTKRNEGMNMTKATKTHAARKIIASNVNALLASAVTIGFDIAGGFERAVALIVQLKSSEAKLGRAQDRYVRGYVARRLQTLYGERLGNAEQAALLKEADLVIGKKSPDSKAADDKKRSVDEHKAVRAASTSWSTAKRQAGIAPTKAGNTSSRKPRPGANAPAGTTATPDGIVQNDAPKFTLAAPKLEASNDADVYFANAIAALLATVDVNADYVSKPWSEFINDTYQRAVAAKLLPSAE